MLNAPEAARSHVARRLARGASLSLALVGMLVLAGWILDVRFLRSLGLGEVPMRPNAALGFILAAVALWQVALRDVSSTASRVVGRVAAALVVLIGGTTLVERVFALDLGFDRLLQRLAHPAVVAAHHTWRMAPASALGFLLSGTALLLQLRLTRGATVVAYALAATVHVIAATAFVGFCYGVRSLSTLGASTAISLPAVIGFMLLSVATLLARPDQELMRVLLGGGAGGLVTRTLLPSIFLGLFLLGWIPIVGERLGQFEPRFGIAVMVMLGVVVATLILVRLASQLCRVDAARRGAQEALEALNANLERKVAERTARLERALAEVKQLSGLIPMCAWCKRIRDDRDYWQDVERYIAARSDAEFTHGICPTCADTLLRRAGLGEE